MSNNTVRIRTTPNGNDKYLKVKLEQDFDFIEILSLKISQEDAYRNFCSDYGVVTGRVIMNSGFGVPNAKISIFIPIDEIDNENAEIKNLYPYDIVSDKDFFGVRYNLLPTNSDNGNPCFTPIGTFPSKREILDNPEKLEIYSKYYKFTTTTNYAGDFMIFGVPVGNHTIHVDADISDIGIASQRPYDSISQGTPLDLFETTTKFKGGTNLDKLVQVKSANIGVNVQPFWGDIDNCEIGITRVDLDLNYTIQPSAIFMGSIFGDQEQQALTKNCTPRKGLGVLCQQISGEGTIDMVRKTINGEIEEFTVNGGQLIDENGSWAYQVPMNLDYVITDEFGQLTLSDDPNKGIPTKASVRFKISMNDSGNGTTSSRAKYLVPNNPTKIDEVDYEFGASTKETSFRDLYWNKIYTVSNYISRFQTFGISGGGRQITGIKNVDDCIGDKTPFPYNKVNIKFTALFFIICLLIQIVGFIIFIVNSIVITFINVLIGLLNFIIDRVLNRITGALCSVGRVKIPVAEVRPFIKILGFACKLKIELIKYVPCIYVRCGEDTRVYSPGCIGENGIAALKKEVNVTNICHGGQNPVDLCGLSDCVAFEMAKSLGLFKFDFYNDWINGSLYSFVISKTKRNKKGEIFCEYDCRDFGISSGGVDNDENGVPDNNCFNNRLVDSCFSGGNRSEEAEQSSPIREGLVKKKNDEFFYAGSTHDGSLKLFATDIILLGSVFECDWQGVPNLVNDLISTTYKLPPEIKLTENGKISETGQVKVGDDQGSSLFFNIDCFGLRSDYRQCLNMRHICEFGVETDQNRQDEGGSIADGNIGSDDIDVTDGSTVKWFRDAFYSLNKDRKNWKLEGLYGSGFNTSFNLLNLGNYDFTVVNQVTGGTTKKVNGFEYIDFRNYRKGGVIVGDKNFGQYENSYYFYFGLSPRKNSLGKLKQSFFNYCDPTIVSEFNILISTTAVSAIGTLDGTVVITFVGGSPNYTFVLSGPNGYIFSGSTEAIVSIIGLANGLYTISSSDSNGVPVNQSFIISDPVSLFAFAIVNKNSTSVLSADGEISLLNIGGGTSPYNYILKNSGGDTITNGDYTSPIIIGNLPSDTALGEYGFGYTLLVSDSAGGSTIVSDLVVLGPSPFTLIITKQNSLCFDSADGLINISTSGGQSPFNIAVTGDNGYTNTSFSNQNLSGGTYNIKVTDVFGTIVEEDVVITNLTPFMEIEAADATTLALQCLSNEYVIKFKVNSIYSGPLVHIQYALTDDENWIPISVSGYTDSSSILTFNIPRNELNQTILVRMTNIENTCFSELIFIDTNQMTLPLVDLTINVNSVTQITQDSNSTVKFKFNISHLVSNEVNRGPYEVKYQVTARRLIVGQTPSQVIGSEQTIEMNNNQQLITGNVAQVNGQNANNCTVKVSVIDNKGCVSNTINININLP